ncbi:MAG: preprotein translocase subunit SecE [Paludibacteraceae bacterium]|nr:preprotein translocase subunit SecE [Paludibacteraceae bacterium]MBP6284075.1 preprotein translocase subunit SecE [Paludibacteraceae bacterium]
MKITNYIKESYNELVHKVSWPTTKELTSSSIIVLIASLIIALIVWLIDFGFEKFIQFIYKLIG